jgi:ATP-dependent Lon protease
MEFYDVHFSYIDLEDGVERFVTVPEQSGGSLVPEGGLQPGTLHTISMGSSEMPGIYRLEIQSIPGTGKANVSGVAPRESVRVAISNFLVCRSLSERDKQRVTIVATGCQRRRRNWLIKPR